MNNKSVSERSKVSVSRKALNTAKKWIEANSGAMYGFEYERSLARLLRQVRKNAILDCAEVARWRHDKPIDQAILEIDKPRGKS